MVVAPATPAELRRMFPRATFLSRRIMRSTLIQAGALINGTSIVRETNVPTTFTYYHVEVEDHSLILAENTPAETFVDNVDRLGFDNWAEHEAIYPNGKHVNELPYPSKVASSGAGEYSRDAWCPGAGNRCFRTFGGCLRRATERKHRIDKCGRSSRQRSGAGLRRSNDATVILSAAAICAAVSACAALSPRTMCRSSS